MYKAIKKVFILTCLFYLILPLKGYAEIYRYIDTNGAVHFKDVPMPGFRKFMSSIKQPTQNNQDNELFGYYIQIGPFTNIKTAQAIQTKLQANEIEAFTYKQGKRNYLVWFGNFRTKKEATDEANKLVSKKIIKKHIVTSRQESNPTVNIESKNSHEANKMEKLIRSKRFEVKFYVECSTGKNRPEPGVVCKMFFPETRNNMRYVHKIEAFTLNIATSFARKDSSEPFELYAVMKDGGDKAAAETVRQSNIQGDYIPVCAFSYSKHFDRLQRIWPSL